jgi:hypothetical protein
MTFLDILQRRQVPFRRSGEDPDEIRICCPFCTENGETPDTRFRLGINIRNGAAHCFNCDFKGRHVQLLVLRRLQVQTEGLELEGVEAPVKAPEPIALPKDFQVLDRTYDVLDRQALNYLLKRGITRKQIIHNRIGVSLVGKLGYRIIFPVWVGKELKGLVARDFTGTQKPKYLNSGGDKYLYHFNPKARTCVLSEGAFKALRIARVLDDPEACSAALLGHDLTTIQLGQLLESKCERVILWPDPDAVGRKGVIGIADKLSEGWSGTVEIAWPIDAPADEMPLSDIRILLKETKIYNWSLRQIVLLNSY